MAYRAGDDRPERFERARSRLVARVTQARARARRLCWLAYTIPSIVVWLGHEGLIFAARYERVASIGTVAVLATGAEFARRGLALVLVNGVDARMHAWAVEVAEECGVEPGAMLDWAKTSPSLR
jgi:hypothetical protein